MRKKKSSLQIPPLSLKALRDVELIEDYVQKALKESTDSVGISCNTERVSRILRTCVVESLDVQIKYLCFPAKLPRWVGSRTH
jgi:hypothetical protein